MNTTVFTDSQTGVEYISISNDDGSVVTMQKSVYDTLPSNSSIPQAGE